MASVTIEKHTSGSASAQYRHNYRENENNSNKQIDPQKSNLNVNLDTRFSTAREAHTALKARVAEVDEVLPPIRKKKDRVVAVCFELPAPRAGMNYEDSVRFLKAAYEAIVDRFGQENIIGSTIHADEQHSYIDSKTKKLELSRIHLHTMVVPYVEGKGINGKAFVTRTLFKEMNKLMDEVCMREFGYTYQDGSKQASRGKTEELKAESLLEQAKVKESLNREIHTKTNQLTEYDTVLEMQTRQIAQNDTAISTLEAQKQELGKEIATLQQQKELFQENTNKVLEELDRARADRDKLKEEIDELTGEKRAQEIVRGERLKEVKISRVYKNMVLVPEDDFIAYANQRQSQTKLYKEKQAFEQEKKQLEEQARITKRNFHAYEKYPEMVKELEKKQQNLEMEIQKQARYLADQEIKPIMNALEQMKLLEKVNDYMNQRHYDDWDYGR